jgi:O-antigen/teichoic acid export membrane protein
MTDVAVPEGLARPGGRRAGHIDLSAPQQTSPVPDLLLGLGGVTIQGSVRFIYSVAIAAVTTAAALGTVNSLLSVAMLASILWPTAAGFAATKYIAIGRSRQDAAEVLGVAGHLGRSVVLTTIVLSVVAALTARTVVDASLVESVMAALLVAAYSIATYVRGVLYGVGQIPRATTWDVLTAGVALVGLTAVLTLDVSTELLLLPLTLGYTCYVVANWPFGQGRGVLRPELRREIDHFVVYAALGSLAGAGLAQLAMVIAKSATTATDAGHFAAALSLAAPAGLLANGVILTTAPSIADLHGRDEHELARGRTDQGTRGLALSMFGLFGVAVLASDPMIRVFFGPGFAAAGPILRVLLVAVLLPALAAAATSSLMVRHGDGQKIFAWCNIAGLAVGLVATAILLAIHPHDVVVVAWGYLLGATVVGLVPLAVVWRREGHRWLTPALQLVAGAVAVLVLRLTETHLDVTLWWDLAVAAGFAAGWLMVFRREVWGLRSAFRPGAAP